MRSSHLDLCDLLKRPMRFEQFMVTIEVLRSFRVKILAARTVGKRLISLLLHRPQAAELFVLASHFSLKLSGVEPRTALGQSLQMRDTMESHSTQLDRPPPFQQGSFHCKR